MILGGDVSMINFIAGKDSDEWIKRQKYAQRCKEKAWKRWKHAYLVALGKRYNLNHKDRAIKVNTGYIIVIKDESKNRGHWKIGKVSQLYTGKDEVTRAFQMKYW